MSNTIPTIPNNTANANRTQGKDSIDGVGVTSVKMREMEWFEVETKIRQLVSQLIGPHLKRMLADREKMEAVEQLKIDLQQKVYEVDAVIRQSNQKISLFESAEQRIRTIQPLLDSFRIDINKQAEALISYKEINQEHLNKINQDILKVQINLNNCEERRDAVEKRQEYIQIQMRDNFDKQNETSVKLREIISINQRSNQESIFAINNTAEQHQIKIKTNSIDIEKLQNHFELVSQKISQQAQQISDIQLNCKRLDTIEGRLAKLDSQTEYLLLKTSELAEYVDKHVPLHVYAQITETLFAVLSSNNQKMLLQNDEKELPILNSRLLSTQMDAQQRQGKLQPIDFSDSQQIFAIKLQNIANRNKSFGALSRAKQQLEESEQVSSRGHSSNTNTASVNTIINKNTVAFNDKIIENNNSNNNQDKKSKDKPTVMPTIEEMIGKQLQSEQFLSTITGLIKLEADKQSNNFDELFDKMLQRFNHIAEESEIVRESCVQGIDAERERLSKFSQESYKITQAVSEGLEALEEVMDKNNQQFSEQAQEKQLNRQKFQLLGKIAVQLIQEIQAEISSKDMQGLQLLIQNNTTSRLRPQTIQPTQRNNSNNLLVLNHSALFNSNKTGKNSDSISQFMSHQSSFDSNNNKSEHSQIKQQQQSLLLRKLSSSGQDSERYKSRRKSISNQQQDYQVSARQIATARNRDDHSVDQSSLRSSSNSNSNMQQLQNNNSQHFYAASFSQQGPLTMKLPKTRKIVAIRKQQMPKTADSSLFSF